MASVVKRAGAIVGVGVGVGVVSAVDCVWGGLQAFFDASCVYMWVWVW